MADQYIDATYIQAHLGSGYEAAAVATSGIVRVTIIEAATAFVQGKLRNSGYSPVSTEDPADVEELVKLATYGAYREMLATIPEAAVALPENWNAHPARMAYVDLVNGELQLAATPSNIAAVGGWQWSESDPDVDDALVQRASREELEGF